MWKWIIAWTFNLQWWTIIDGVLRHSGSASSTNMSFWPHVIFCIFLWFMDPRIFEFIKSGLRIQIWILKFAMNMDFIFIKTNWTCRDSEVKCSEYWSGSTIYYILNKLWSIDYGSWEKSWWKIFAAFCSMKTSKAHGGLHLEWNSKLRRNIGTTEAWVMPHDSKA